MEEQRKKVYLLIDNFIEKSLNVQNLDLESPNYGGFLDPESLTCESFIPAYLFSLYAQVFHLNSSSYYHNAELLKRAQAALSFLVTKQYDDGTFDVFFGAGDKHSAPNAAFLLTPLTQGYLLWGKLLGKDNREKLLQIIKRAADAAGSKTMHTANHPWIAVGGLAAAYQIVKDESYKLAAQRRLEEGIDINEDGTYDEKSAIYSLAINMSFLAAAKVFGFNYLLGYVRKNTEFLVHNIYPNGEFVTEYSSRYDAEGATGTYALGALFFRKMAKRFSDSVYEGIAQLLFQRLLKARLNEYLFHGTLISPDLTFNKDKMTNFFATATLLSNIIDYFREESLKESYSIPRDYEKYYPQAKIFRKTLKDISYTVICKPNMLGYRCGDITIEGFRIMAQSTGWRIFEPQNIKINEKNGRVELKGTFSSRVIGDKRYEAEVEAEVNFKFQKDMLIIGVETKGLRDTLLLYEFGLRRQGLAEVGGQLFSLTDRDKILLSDNEYLKVHYQGSSILIGPGVVQHRRTEDIEIGRRIWTPSFTITRLLFTPVVPNRMNIQIRKIY